MVMNKFFEVYLSIATNNPEMLLKDCYEMAEKWHKWKFGRRRYKNLQVFKNKYYSYLRRNLNQR